MNQKRHLVLEKDSLLKALEEHKLTRTVAAMKIIKTNFITFANKNESTYLPKGAIIIVIIS